MRSVPFKTALNTATLHPFELSVPEQIDVAADAGFDGIELWVRDVITVADRVMPGDGVGPVAELYDALSSIGYEGYLSVELFRAEYRAGSAAGVAAEAREKTVRVWDQSRE